MEPWLVSDAASASACPLRSDTFVNAQLVELNAALAAVPAVGQDDTATTIKPIVARAQLYVARWQRSQSSRALLSTMTGGSAGPAPFPVRARKPLM